MDEYILDAIRAGSSRAGVDIPTILDRVDSDQRWLLTFEELEGGLRRLSERGLIRKIAIGRYVASGSRQAPRSYSGITRERYEAAAAAYRTAFARDVEQVMSSRLLRGFTGLFRLTYRLTGGRLGLAPGIVDLDAVAIAFSVELVLVPFGASTEDFVLEGDTLVVRVVEGDTRLDRPVIAERVRLCAEGVEDAATGPPSVPRWR